MKDCEECWVTLALSDRDALESLVLARSLKRALTTRKRTILISDIVTHQMKCILSQEYDHVVRVEKDDLSNGLEMDQSAAFKLFAWTLHTWHKCIFIDSKSLVQVNCDDLFQCDEFSAGENEIGKLGTNLFLFKPSHSTFEELVQLAHTMKSTELLSVLRAHFKDIHAVCGVSYDVMDEIAVEFETEPKIIRFQENLCLKDESSSITHRQRGKWLEIYYQDVIPLLRNQKRDTIAAYVDELLASVDVPSENVECIRHALPASTLDELHTQSIAVIGMSCRFPSANSITEYWDLLTSGTDAIKYFPSNRPICAVDEEMAKKMQAGFLTCAVDEFDAKLFGISPREAPFIDPQQRLLLEVTWESLENSGINPQSLRDSNTGVFLGIWQQDYERLLPDVLLSANDFFHRYLGNEFSATASRISYCLGLHGPAIATESGCSSALGGLHLACESLRRGETSLAIASGVNLVLIPFNPFSGKGEEAVVLSKDFRCKTFDESADGFVRAEGCGVVILKRYADACRDGDNILALIRGSALNNDGAGTSFGTPNAKAQIRVFREALKNSNVKPSEVSFLEAHGTGTVVGDPIEMYAIGEVYSEERLSSDPLYVSSVKTNIGHCEAAAGIASVIKMILCLQNGLIPPHLNLKTLNQRINLDRIPAKIPQELTPWPGENKIGAVSSFSMSGTNVHMIIQQAPPIIKHATSSIQQTLQLVTMSTKSEESLIEMSERYVKYLSQNGENEVSLYDVAFAANTGRAHLTHRIAVVAKDRAQLLAKLEKQTFLQGKVPAIKNKIGFLFTGQGSQYIGMGKNLYETFPVFQQALDRCDALFRDHLDQSLCHVIWNEDVNLLEKTVYCQPSIFCIQYALIQLWKSFGITPDFVLGHSVGEFAASVAAGVLSLEDAMKLVVSRSELVNKLNDGAMLALRCPEEKVMKLIQTFNKESEHWIDVAAVNSPDEIVVSGQVDCISHFRNVCLNNGVKYVNIPASHAFHSRDMDKILGDFGILAATVKCHKPICTYISGTLSKPMEELDFTSSYWQRHLRDTVHFADAIQLVYAECKVLVEIGAQPILLGLAMGNLSETTNGSFCPSLRKNEEDSTNFFTTLAKLYTTGVDVDWSRWFVNKTKKLTLPNYPFQRQKFWFSSEISGDSCLGLNTPLLHPLLGRQFPSPLEDVTYCQNYNLKDLSWIEDHKVVEKIIVPAASYLESFLAAGKQILQSGSRVPLIIEHLSVDSAMELEKSINIQTIVSSRQNNENNIQYKLTINRQLEGQIDKWKQHSSAIFSPTSRLPENRFVDLGEVKGRLKHSESLDKVYESISEVGIKFGPKFQSIREAWGGDKELLTKIYLPEGHEDYICHPIVLDALIQTCAFREYLISGKSNEEKSLSLPVSIRKFIWLSKTPSPIVYAYSSTADGNVSLYNEIGELLAIMEGLELIRTTTDTIIRALRSSDSLEVDRMSEIWRQKLSIVQSRIDLTSIPPPTLNSPYVVALRQNTLIHLEKLSRYLRLHSFLHIYYVLRSVNELNWPWGKVGGILHVDKWRRLLPSTLNPLVADSYLMELTKYGPFLSYTDESGVFQILKDIPSLVECEDTITNFIQTLRPLTSEGESSLPFAIRFGDHLTRVLQGKITGLSVLFPEDENAVGAIKFYTEGEYYLRSSELGVVFCWDAVAPLANTKDGIVRILEVGAGSGAAFIQIRDKLKELNIPYSFTFTDISPILVSEAKKKFGPEVSYKILNIEDDPLSQGFAPEEFDFVIAMQVLHATEDIKAALVNINKLLRPGGRIVIAEQFSTIPSITFPFSMLDGWWRFNDFRKLSPIVDEETWKLCVKESGFADTQTTVMMEDVHLGALVATKLFTPSVSEPILPIKKVWIVFDDETSLGEDLIQKLSRYGRTVVRVRISGETNNEQSEGIITLSLKNISEIDALYGHYVEQTEGVLYLWTTLASTNIQVDQLRIIAPILNIMQAYNKFGQKVKRKSKMVLVTRGVSYIGDTSAGNPNGATAWGVFKTVLNEYPELPGLMMDLDQNGSEFESAQIFAELWCKEKELFVGFRQEKRFVQRLIYMDKEPSPLPLPNTDRYKFINPPSGAFSDIQVGPHQKLEVDRENVEVEIRATALNFRDLFMVLKPEGFNLPKDQLDSIGLDISGVVLSVGPEVKRLKPGDEVFGFTSSGGLASHVIAPEKILMRKPKWMTFNEASTIPCAFLTAYVCLVESAKVTAEDRVLVHVASGGVGLAAIQILKHIGAEIYATAGNKRKRAYLKNLGIKYIYHSRNTSYGEGISRDTDGHGVTVVLNSLTGPNFKETTLGVCSDGARFLEIAKLNIWQPDEVTALRPDVKYDIFDLSTMDIFDETRTMFREMEKYVHDGIYKGLPSVNFSLDQVKKAFYYFQEAKHIGKIVVTMPKATYNNGKLALTYQIFNTESTYLITGGLGGIGIEVTKWMLTKGAKNIVLAGRSPPHLRVQKLLDDWNAAGGNVIVKQTDIGIYENCVALLHGIQEMGLPPLRGIMHAAGIISDNFIPNQTLEAIETVFGPKVYGGWHLHQLTLGYSLEFFILFSSMTAMFGMIGQCNHVAANRFLDSLAHLRESMGLPALTINWGAWSDVGAAAHIKLGQEGLSGIRAFTPAQGIASLEKIMMSHYLQVGVIDIGDWRLVKMMLSGGGNYMEEMKSEDRDIKKLSAEFDHLVQEIHAASPEEKQDKIQTFMEHILKETLKLPEAEVIDIDQNFGELGVDSLMAMEMKNRLQGILGDKTLTVSGLQENRTIRSLSCHLARIINAEVNEDSSLSQAELIQHDILLPIDIQPAETGPCKPSEYKEIFLTGATGHLGVHILLELLTVRPDLTIHCLIRSKSSEEAKKRLLRTLKTYEVESVNLERVCVVPGDITHEKLGLDSENYTKLTSSVDAVLHCAIKANHLENYSDGSRSDMRTHNVLALHNILRFVTAVRTKALFHASTLLAVTTIDAEGKLSEEFPLAEDKGDLIRQGYSLSKFIGEKLLAQAVERRIPCTVLRYPSIFGHSETGIMPPGYNHGWNILLSCIRVRMIPKVFHDGIPLTPVDISARISVGIFLSDTAEIGVYNYTSDSRVSEEDILEVFAEFGIQAEFVPFMEWRDAVFDENADDTNILGPLSELYKNTEDSERAVLFNLHPLGEVAETIDFKTFSQKLEKNMPGSRDLLISPKVVLQRHLQHHYKTLTSRP